MSSACLQQSIFIFHSDRSMAGTRNGGGGLVDITTRAAEAHDKCMTQEDAPPSKAAMDRWLNEKLQMLYGPVLSEPIPEQLAQLIAAHRRNEEDC